MVQNLSTSFKMSSISWLNKLAQTKKVLFNKAHIAYETTLGSFASDALTFGSDGSNAQRNEKKQTFDRLYYFNQN